MTSEESTPPTELPGTTYPFGPGFFLGQLRAFAREHCPDPAERLPAVTVHLATGEELELCHVVGIAPGFVALAVRESEPAIGGTTMRTELVSYALVTRVTIRPASAAGKHVGFNPGRLPAILSPPMSPEEALRCTTAAPPGDRGSR